MGDILHALPGGDGAAPRASGWEIDWVVEPRWRALLAAPESDGRGPGAAHRRSPLLCADQRTGGKAVELCKTTHEIKALRDQLKAVTL